MLLRVGLTGGIASGKSTVLAVLKELECTCFDADQMVRELMAAGTPLSIRIIERFGRRISTPGGGIDRKTLAGIVFRDAALLADLEGLVHPELTRVMNERAAALENDRSSDGAIFVVDAALLMEKRPDIHLHRVVVATCPEDVQIERLTRRDGMTHGEALLRIRIQMSSEEKERLADYVVETSGTPEVTRRRTVEVYGKLKSDLQALCSGKQVKPRAYRPK